MNFSDMALRMFPYWILGLFMVYATYKSRYKDLLRFDIQGFKKFVQFMGMITLWRILLFSIFKNSPFLHEQVAGVMTIPWQATLTVFWEDACHGLPLAILASFLGTSSKWRKAITYSAIGFTMLAFGLGHVYQGFVSAAFLSLYIPFTFKKGQEFGFGTVMACHTLYDLLTILTIKLMLG